MSIWGSPPLPFQDGKVNGVTESTRILGYTFLHPSVVPRPHVQSVPLTPQDEFFILGSKGLWDSLSSEEAVAAVRHVPDALAAGVGVRFHKPFSLEILNSTLVKEASGPSRLYFSS